MSLRLFLPLALFAAAAGLAAGWFGHALSQRRALPEPARRSPQVLALLRAYERGAWKDVTREDAGRVGDEALLIWAMANRDRETLRVLEQESADVSVRARALAFEPQEHMGFVEFLKRLAQRHPDSWMLQQVRREPR